MDVSDLAGIRPPPPISDGVFVYILTTSRGCFYVGSAKDVARRLGLHRLSRGAAFTRDQGVAKLVYVEGPFDLKTAVQREFQLKRWSRAKKAALIRGDLRRLRVLSRSRD